MLKATDANVITRLGREEKWVKLHSNVRGPESSLFFFGANNAIGYVLYGHSLPKKNMVDLLTQKKERSRYVRTLQIAPASVNILHTFRSSRYFKLLNGKEFKWAVGSHFMEVRLILFSECSWISINSKVPGWPYFACSLEEHPPTRAPRGSSDLGNRRIALSYGNNDDSSPEPYGSTTWMVTGNTRYHRSTSSTILYKCFSSTSLATYQSHRLSPSHIYQNVLLTSPVPFYDTCLQFNQFTQPDISLQT